MNVSKSKTESLIKMCPMNKMVWKLKYQVEKIAIAMTAIILNNLSFPVLASCQKGMYYERPQSNFEKFEPFRK